MGKNFKKFILIMWKNWINTKRNWIRATVSILIPVILVLLIEGMRSAIKYIDKSEINYYPKNIFHPNSNETFLNISGKTKFEKIFYSPNDTEIYGKIDETLIKYADKLEGFENSEKLNRFLEENYQEDNSIAAIQFQHSILTNLEKKIQITLRLRSDEKPAKKVPWYVEFLFPGFQLPGPRDETKYDPKPNYYGRGFLQLQRALSEHFFEKKTINITIQRFPYPEYKSDPFFTAMENAFPIMFLLSFMWVFIDTVRAITLEKEKQLKESMKIMGLPGWLHWLAWFLRTFILLIISVILMIIILKAHFSEMPIFPNSDGFLLFIYFTIYIFSLITFSFLVSVFFSKANIAAALGGILWFLSYLPFVLMVPKYDTLALSDKLGSSLLSNTALSYGLLLIMKFEAIEEGLQWNNIWTTVSPDDDLQFGYLLILLIVDSIFYLSLALYIEAIFPGQFGVPKPFYFLVTRSFWLGTPSESNLSNNFELNSKDKNSEFFEPFLENIPAGIRIQNLSKHYGKNAVVKDLKFNMYEGQITVLLGHNGAGKTTTMSMLTGMILPTNGTALVAGHDIRTDVSGVRDSMGLCLQHNVLFDNMTVREHLYFFGKLKGLGSNEIDHEINNYLVALELEDKINALSSTLSGGMKRKLSVGIALIGNSKVVMLDEPTAGMDPSARRVIWNLLQQQKHGRTILLTTHFMDEADLLGDRIAIMAAGELQCLGSSFFLKKKYGAGYYLIIDKSQNSAPDKITKLLRKHIPNIEIQSNIGSELTYLLAESESSKFEEMLGDLEKNITTLNIESYGVSLTTLEEVFMKVGADKDNKESLIDISLKNTNNRPETRVPLENDFNKFDNNMLLDGPTLILNQFRAAWLKKWLSMMRSRFVFPMMILLPVGLLVLTSILSINIPENRYYQPLDLTIDTYPNMITLVSNNSSNGDKSSISDAYKSILKESGKDIIEVGNIKESILKKTKENPSNVKLKHIIGVEFSDDYINAWFNGDPYHSPPISLSLVINAYLQSIQSETRLDFVNHPIPYDLNTRISDVQFNGIGLQYGIILGFGMSFVGTLYVLFYIKERASKNKHLQLVSGMNLFIFWGTSFLFDLLVYGFVMIALILTFLGLQEEGFSSAEDLARIAVILLYFIFPVLPLMYLSSFIFSVPSTGFSRIMLVGSIISMVGVVLISVLEIDSIGLTYIAKPVHWVLALFPHYGVAKGIFDMNLINMNNGMCKKYLEMANELIVCSQLPYCCNMVDDYFQIERPAIGGIVLISYLMALFLCIFLLAIEYDLFSRLIRYIFKYNSAPQPLANYDSDVLAEIKRIQNTPDLELTKRNHLILRDVTKYYKNFLAVNGLCLTVSPYECFGLLGVNGAGKTTTFKMMTGDERISSGDARICGFSVTNQQKEAQTLIGYCPQFDALLDDLTARETLRIFALIRGLSRVESEEVAVKLAHDFDFFKHLDKEVRELSGGTKRKLSTSLALIGDPPVVFLDEPTAGMDPATKRYLWNTLCKLRDNGKCIVLTSHSMEECQAMCTRVAIMVNGVFQCLGSTQHLKNKFAQGYALIVKLKKELSNRTDSTKHVTEFVQRHFSGASITDSHGELISFQLPYSATMPWSQMFGLIEKNKSVLNIEDYSLGQCSLEQVFLSFTKHQIEDKLKVSN